jgi:peptidoglycan hydrolase CwlO-like protein
MAGVTEQNQSLTDLMKQLLDGFNTLKAGQIETQEAVRGIQARTEAMEARVVDAARQAAATPPPGAAPSTNHAAATTAAAAIPPGAATTMDPSSSLGMLHEMGYGAHDRRAAIIKNAMI